MLMMPGCQNCSQNEHPSCRGSWINAFQDGILRIFTTTLHRFIGRACHQLDDLFVYIDNDAFICYCKLKSNCKSCFSHFARSPERRVPLGYVVSFANIPAAGLPDGLLLCCPLNGLQQNYQQSFNNRSRKNWMFC